MNKTRTDFLASVDASERSTAATLLVLSEIAHADRQFDSTEQASILSALTQTFGVSGQRVSEMLVYVERTRQVAPDLTRLSRLIHGELPAERDRRAVVHAMWQVVLADGTTTAMEERLANAISSLLGVSFKHVEEIRADLRHRV
jgi:uncharacterized tellurite resistance protein B-like protein